MAGLMDAVDSRTRLAGHNRLELLLFTLGGQQLFALNVFKIKEVVHCPPLNSMPASHPAVCGVTNMRGITFPVLDMAKAIGGRPQEITEESIVIVTEYNRRIHGFLVSSVDRIVNKNWEDILAPPAGTARSYVTAVTRIDNKIVEIIDVEKIMYEVMGQAADVSDEILEKLVQNEDLPNKIMVVDDSSVARNQIVRTLKSLDFECLVANNGREALTMLQNMSNDGPLEKQLALVISDVEMPDMDGYTLTTEIRKDPMLNGLYVIFHTSLSGVFNNSMVESVGANKFISKFNADELATGIMSAIDELKSKAA